MLHEVTVYAEDWTTILILYPISSWKPVAFGAYKRKELWEILPLTALSQCCIPPEKHNPQLVFRTKVASAHVLGNCLV